MESWNLDEHCLWLASVRLGNIVSARLSPAEAGRILDELVRAGTDSEFEEVAGQAALLVGAQGRDPELEREVQLTHLRRERERLQATSV